MEQIAMQTHRLHCMGAIRPSSWMRQCNRDQSTTAFSSRGAVPAAKQVPLRVAILGAGRIARVHAEGLRRVNADTRWVCASRIESAEQLAKQYQIPNWTTNAHEAITNPDVDAVVICSPTEKHAEQIVTAALHGKHIFCEKPIDLSLAVVDHALKEVEKAGVKMMVGFQRRFDANFQRIRRAITSDEIGAVTMLRITSRDPSPPPLAYIKASGGMFQDMTIHDFDMARYLVGAHDEVDEVFVMTQSRNAGIAAAGDIDTAVCLLKFKSGIIAHIENSRDAAYGYDQRVEVLGAKGSVACDNNHANNVIVSTGESVRRDLPLHFFLERYMDAYVAEMEAFLHAVGSAEGQVPVNGHDGREAMLLALAANRSRVENRPVKVAELLVNRLV